MKNIELENWVSEIRENFPKFFSQLQSNSRKGFLHYSLRGDYFDERMRWGLGNVVFALKVHYTLGTEPDNLQEMKNFILKFQKKDGSFSDPLVGLLAFPHKVLNSLKNFSAESLSSKETVRAQTRQTISALHLFGLDRELAPYENFPKNKTEIEGYLEGLGWGLPWGAGSHFSHLLFFIAFSKLENKKDLMDFAIDWAKKIQQEDGFWFEGGNVPLQQKINGAMKVITGLKVASSVGGWNDGKVKFSNAEKIVDACLEAQNDSHACDNFNIVYVLKYCNEVLGGQYRKDEIEGFMLRRLDHYRKFYFPEMGAFSFHLGKANRTYYGAIITRGLNEPDIHGTALFLWGMAVIADFFGADKDLNIREFIT